MLMKNTRERQICVFQSYANGFIDVKITADEYTIFGTITNYEHRFLNWRPHSFS